MARYKPTNVFGDPVAGAARVRGGMVRKSVRGAKPAPVGPKPPKVVKPK